MQHQKSGVRTFDQFESQTSVVSQEIIQKANHQRITIWDFVGTSTYKDINNNPLMGFFFGLLNIWDVV